MEVTQMTGWAGSAAPTVRLNGGDVCPTCGKSTLCMNGSVALFGHRIVTCHGCTAVRCARCGNPACKTDTPQGERFSCTSCKP
ncbi:MAG: hypothetical protein Q7S23_00995 [bacterium]|nr:hypothetical protein [bacterium]